MKEKNIKRIMIAGTNSGCGKTTITCALLKALVNRGLNVSSFKCGPDYIDPMFHKKIIGTPSYNLDVFLTGENNVKYLFGENTKDSDMAVIEGVMGFYDGLGGNTNYGSSCQLSLLTETKVILIIDAKGMSYSINAIINGFKNFSKNNIEGIILNRCSTSTYKFLKNSIEICSKIKVFGYMPFEEEVKISSRHLGLITANEITDIEEKVCILGELCEKYIDIDGILETCGNTSKYSYEEVEIKKICNNKNIAIAYDNAFCFYYEDNITLLKKLGANIVYFSPINDESLPENTHGLILGGGYPENNLEKLSGNKSMIKSIKNVIDNGTPTLAECGGFMYLHEKMCGYSMVGEISGECYMTNKLNRFGYVKLTAKEDNLLCQSGESINGHEFHYSESSNPGNDFVAEKHSGKVYECIHGNKSLYAGYPHLNLWGNLKFAENFVKSL